MDKKIIEAFLLGGIFSLGTFAAVETIKYKIICKQSNDISEKAYKTLRDAFAKDSELAEYYKKHEPKNYKKIMES